MTPQRRTALASVAAATVLLGLKLGTGLATGSLGLVSEALHSGTDLVAAALTFFAIGVSGRPADRGHPFGHGKAEHLAALAEATVLALVSVVVGALAVARLTGALGESIETAPWVFAVVGVVLAIDVSRTLSSYRAGRRYGSEALLSNALHFGSDLAGTVAVLAGLVAARQGFPEGDSLAALFVAGLVLLAAARLIRRNVDVLMDRSPEGAEDAARRAIAAVRPTVELSRLRMRQSASRHFVDIVIAVPPGAAVGQGHAIADRVEDAVEQALPGSDVVVHVEPRADEAAALRERALAAAFLVPRVREIHNMTLMDVDGTIELSLHLKLPGELSLEEAHEVAERVEVTIMEVVPEIGAVQTHLEPLTEASAAVELAPDDVARIVREVAGTPPRGVRVLRTSDGLVAFVTLGLDAASTLADAHGRASEIEERLRREHPEIADVIVHTEP
jgi:cation diffusion facilitator family transporter